MQLNPLNVSETAFNSAKYAYLLLELLRRIKAKGKTAFSNFVEKIRICLCYYLTLDYVIERIQPLARKITQPKAENLTCGQIPFFQKSDDLFSSKKGATPIVASLTDYHYLGFKKSPDECEFLYFKIIQE